MHCASGLKYAGVLTSANFRVFVCMAWLIWIRTAYSSKRTKPTDEQAQLHMPYTN
jgi:ABC-type anion transport system duplicated permease subunit